MVAPIVSGHAGLPVKLRGAQRDTGQGDKSITWPGTKWLMFHHVCEG